MRTVILVLALFAPMAFAQEVCPAQPSPGPNEAWLCWKNGSSGISKTRIQHVRVAANAACDFPTNLEPVDVPPTTLGQKYTGLTNGKHCWRLLHVATDQFGNEFFSAWSVVVQKAITGG